MAANVEAQFAKLQEFAAAENWRQALSVCDQILKLPGLSNDEDALKCKVVCLMKMDRFADALPLCSSEKLRFERAYCLYRLQRLEEALQECPQSSTSPAMQHLRAQLLYRVGQYDECSNIYGTMMDSGAGDDADLKTNTYASYTLAGRAQEVMQDYPPDQGEMEENFELRFNLASALISTGDLEGAASELRTAYDTVAKVLDEEDVAEEQAPIALQQAYVAHRMQKTEEALSTYMRMLREFKNNLELNAVAANNLAVLRGDKDLPDSLRRLRSTINKDAEAKLSLPQLQTIRYNRCLLLLMMKKADECVRALDGLEQQFGRTARADMIRAAAFVHQNRWKDCDELIESSLSQHGSTRAGDELQLFKAQTQIIRGDLAAAVRTLQGIQSLQGTPALVSVLYALHAALDDREQMLQVLAQAKQAVADGSAEEGSAAKLTAKIAQLYESLGMQEQASEAFIDLLNSGSLDAEERLHTVARLVCVLSKSDEDAAELHASHLPQVNADDIVAEDLEQAELPRSRTKISQPEAKVVEKTRKPRTAEQKAKKRAKEKEKYLAKLIEQGKYDPRRPTFPDPERWTPRKQRSYGKRGRRNRGKFSGAQGSGDGAQKDAAKLDAAKRAAEAKAKQAEAKPAPTGGRRRPGRR